MKKATILLITLMILSACASNASRRIASARSIDPDIIELDSPLKAGLNAEVLGYKEAKAHTVYDGFATAEKYKEKSTAQLVEFMAGPYKFYLVKENETLASIAQQLYGNPEKAKQIQSWNYEMLPTDEDLKPGMKLKYLPKNRMPASK